MTPPLTPELLLARVKTLPPLPEVVFELQEALRSDDVEIDRIVRAISSDPALTVTALRLANSPFYGVSGRVVTLRDAVQILGLQTLSAAVITAAVMARFDRNACPRFDFDACWRHAIATALCAQMLAQRRGVDADTAYTAGLLHDVGRLALAMYFPQAFDATLALAAEEDLSPIDAERRMLGIDHAMAGGMVARHWRLAPVIVDSIALHHDVPSLGQEGGNGHHALLDILHLADSITHALDLSQAPDERVPPLSLETWERMHLTNAELQQLFERIEARMQSFEAVPA